MRRAIVGADVFDGTVLHRDAALLIEDGLFRTVVARAAVPAGWTVRTVEGGTILPGFVDLQVNGGGGVMFNDETSVEGLEAIAAAHRGLGTRALLPTLITDSPEKVRAAIDAVEAAVALEMPGIAGLHLEGPHLSFARKGAHDPALIRPMEDADEAVLVEAAARLPALMVTLAPESVPPDRIARLAAAGIVVSLGHSDCGLEAARASFAAGARCATHLFNAMSQLGSREPGLVGAVLEAGAVDAGLIADGVHVHPSALRAALAAKRGPGRLFLVTDAMATAGSEIAEFRLNGRRVRRSGGRLTLEDGTLAGADLDMSTALRVLGRDAGVARRTAYAMATSGPGRLIGGAGRLVPGRPFDGVRLDGAGALDPEFGTGTS